MNMHYKATLIALVAAGVLVGRAEAEKVNMSPAKLRDTATHVIVGKVVATYKRTKTEGNWRYIQYVSEIQVSDAEKGEGLKKGDLVYARYWQRTWQGEGYPPPSTSGHRGLPGEGDAVRVYLARNAYDGFSKENNDGGYNVIGANGFEKLKAPPEK